MTKVYLDACCLNRPFDDQTQDRIRLESEAILLILSRFEAGEWEWASSSVVDFEIEQTPDTIRRERIKLLTTYVDHFMLVEQAEVERGQTLQALGFTAYDALHIACAERSGADVLLTTDDKMLRRAQRLAGQLAIRLVNPLQWLQEVTEE